MRPLLRRLTSSLAAITVLAAAPEAGASVSPPGPVLTTGAPALAAALSCPQGVRGDRDPVLLVPGASGDPTTAFAGLEPALRAHDYAICGVTLPDAGFGDLQIQAEYVAASIRRIAATSGRPVNVIAISSGGAASRWALTWWPDLRSLVGDFIGLAPGNHGVGPTLVSLCGGPCPPATRQLQPGSRFFAALDRGDETPGRLAYSMISSSTDVNVPASFSELEGDRDDTNILLQAICPGRSVDHGHVNSDAVAVALVLDALGHAGPARGSRITTSTCDKTYADGVDPVEVERQLAAGLDYTLANYTRAGLTEVEPSLATYTTRPAPRPRATLRIDPHRVRAGEPTRVTLLAAGTSGGESWPLAGARIEIAGRELITDANGEASARLRFRGPHLLRVRLVPPGLAPVTEHLRVGKRL